MAKIRLPVKQFAIFADTILIQSEIFFQTLDIEQIAL